MEFPVLFIRRNRRGLLVGIPGIIGRAHHGTPVASIHGTAVSHGILPVIPVGHTVVFRRTAPEFFLSLVLTPGIEVFHDPGTIVTHPSVIGGKVVYQERESAHNEADNGENHTEDDPLHESAPPFVLGIYPGRREWHGCLLP